MPNSFTFTWNGTDVSALPEDTVAEALFRAGYRSLGSSRKRHRPMGLSGSFVQAVLAEVDGIPNRRLDEVIAKPGMVVTRQNVWPSTQVDLLKLFRYLPPRWIRGGFEHTSLMPSGTRRFLIWERLLAFLAGEGRLSPEPLGPAVIPGRVMTCDTLVIGGGPAGRQAANAASRAGKKTILLYRGAQPGRRAAAILGGLELLRDDIAHLVAHEAFGIYRHGALVAAAPIGDGPAVALHCGELVIATGKRSCPPVVPGNHLPGVMDANTALRLAARPRMAQAFSHTIVIGTDHRDDLAGQLRAAGINVTTTLPVEALRRILGKDAVEAVDIGKILPCQTVVHAGPWISDPNLPFQASSDGILRLGPSPSPGAASHVRLVGSAAEADEAIPFDPASALTADVCPCMDVTAAEICDLLQAGTTHVEELKRQTSCGMGPCQGFPCWDMLNAVLRQKLGAAYVSDRPSHRGPRRAVTVAQAAGLHDLVEPQQ